MQTLCFSGETGAFIADQVLEGSETGGTSEMPVGSRLCRFKNRNRGTGSQLPLPHLTEGPFLQGGSPWTREWARGDFGQTAELQNSVGLFLSSGPGT